MTLFTLPSGYETRERFAWLPTSIPQKNGGTKWVWWERYYERFQGTHTEVWQ